MHFFGLNIKDVIESIKKAPVKAQPSISTTFQDKERYSCVWVGVVSTGNVNLCLENELFTKKLASKILYLPPGYECVRNVKISDFSYQRNCLALQNPNE